MCKLAHANHQRHFLNACMEISASRPQFNAAERYSSLVSRPAFTQHLSLSVFSKSRRGRGRRGGRGNPGKFSNHFVMQVSLSQEDLEQRQAETEITEELQEANQRKPPSARIISPLTWVFQQLGTLFGSPHNKDHNILGSVLGPLIFANSHNSFRGKVEVARDTSRSRLGPAMRKAGPCRLDGHRS